MRSKFITRLGWFAVIGSVLSVFFGCVQLLSFKTIASNPDLAPLLVSSWEERMGSGWTIEAIQSLFLRNGLSTVSSGLLGVIIGVALLQRRSWSRVAAIYLIAAVTLVMLAGAVSFPMKTGASIYWAGWILTLLAVIIHSGLIIRLRSPEIRAEFGS